MPPTQSFHHRFPTNDHCLQYLLHARFAGHTCPHCGRTGLTCFHRHRTKQCYTCNCGKYHLYPRAGTIFQRSSLPLKKWFLAVHLIHHNQAMPATQLQAMLNVTYPTAWKMKQKIQNTMQEELYRTIAEA